MKKTLLLLLGFCFLSCGQPLMAESSSSHRRTSYPARVEQELRVMQSRMRALQKKPVSDDLKERIDQSMQTLQSKYEAARVAFHHWQAASESEKPARRKAVDAALVDMRKFYTKVLNRFRG
jgi:hypothetical protein